MALGLEKNHRLHLIESDKYFSAGDFTVIASYASHDAAEPVNFLVHGDDDCVLYVTDTGFCGGSIAIGADEATKILLETNFSEADLKNSTIDFSQKKRILENHLSLEKAAEFLTQTDLTECKEIYLIHISARHGDGEEFKNLIQKVVGDNIKVIVAKNKELE